jgi:hypothetical protein
MPARAMKRPFFYKLSFLFVSVTKNILGPERPIFSNNSGFLSVMNNTVVLKRAISCSLFLLDYTAFSYPLPWLSVTTFLATYLIIQLTRHCTYFNHQGGGRMFLNVNTCLQGYTVSQYRRPKSEHPNLLS